MKGLLFVTENEVNELVEVLIVNSKAVQAQSTKTDIYQHFKVLLKLCKFIANVRS